VSSSWAHLTGQRLPALFVAACALAALAPLFPLFRKPADASSAAAFPGWPTTFDGRPLVARPLLARERRFAAGFPGRIATFGDGRRLYVVRWVTRATRRLHPAADCYRGAGYTIVPRPLARDEAGRAWGTFTAVRGTTRLRVRERIADAADATAFTDASSWYWAALLGRVGGPWWAWTVVETEGTEHPAVGAEAARPRRSGGHPEQLVDEHRGVAARRQHEGELQRVAFEPPVRDLGDRHPQRPPAAEELVAA
jgi:hypothetical protein